MISIPWRKIPAKLHEVIRRPPKREAAAFEAALLEQRVAAVDAGAWDRQLEADVEAGKLDALAERALDAHAEGRSTKA